MKKTISLALTFMLLTFSVPAAFAGSCTLNCGLSAAKAIQNTADHLNGSSGAGADFINTILGEAITRAKAWKPDALLAEFTYDENPGSEAGITFRFIGTNDKDKIFEYSLGGATTEKDNSGKLNYGIFTVPVRMRDLTGSMLKDKTLLPSLDSLFGPDTFIVPHFRLAKNAANHLIWTITLTDTKSGKSYLVKANAQDVKTPQFMILAVR